MFDCFWFVVYTSLGVVRVDVLTFVCLAFELKVG